MEDAGAEAFRIIPRLGRAWCAAGVRVKVPPARREEEGGEVNTKEDQGTKTTKKKDNPKGTSIDTVPRPIA